MPGRVPLMAAGSRRALGDIGNQLGGGLTSRNGAKDQPVKYVVARASHRVIAPRACLRESQVLFFFFLSPFAGERERFHFFSPQRAGRVTHTSTAVTIRRENASESLSDMSTLLNNFREKTQRAGLVSIPPSVALEFHETLVPPFLRESVFPVKLSIYNICIFFAARRSSARLEPHINTTNSFVHAVHDCDAPSPFHGSCLRSAPPLTHLCVPPPHPSYLCRVLPSGVAPRSAPPAPGLVTSPMLPGVP